MLEPEQEIGTERRESGLRLMIFEAAFSNTTGALTTGVILTAFALHLGASNAAIGLLAAIPFFAQLAQLPAIWLVERLRARKRIAVLSSVVGRSMLGAMALLPFAGTLALPGLIALTLVLCAMSAIGGCAWNAWIRDLAPEDRMGDVFARRTIYATITTLLAGLAAAVGLEFSIEGSPERDMTFALLYAVGCLAGLTSAVIVAYMPEPRMPANEDARLDLVNLMASPFRDRNFARLIVFIAAWQFAVNFATPFFTVFMVRQLGYSMTMVMGLSIASQLANAVMLRNWGRLSDRFANKSVLLVSAPVYILCIVAMVGASQLSGGAGGLAWLAGLHILMGGAMGGATLAVTNIALKLSPKGQATAYVAVNSLVSAVAAGMAPVLGGLLADFFAARRLELALRWIDPTGVQALIDLRLSNWDFYFLVSGVVGLYALHRLSLVQENGEVDRREIMRQIVGQTRSAVHNLSSVTGVKALTEIPGGLLREARIRARWLRIRGSRTT